MLTCNGKRGLEILLTAGTTLCIYPFSYDGIEYCLKPATSRQWTTFLFHKYVIYALTGFSGGRLYNAWTADDMFPIGYESRVFHGPRPHINNHAPILNQWVSNPPVFQFFAASPSHRAGGQDSGQSSWNWRQDKSRLWSHREDRYQQSWFQWRETDSAVESLSSGWSLFSGCKPFGSCQTRRGKSMYSKLFDINGSKMSRVSNIGYPTSIHTSLDDSRILFRHHSVLLVVIQLDRNTSGDVLGGCSSKKDNASWAEFVIKIHNFLFFRKRLATKSHFNLESYREAEVALVMMNDAFVWYLIAFPALLFAIVSVLILGVIEIWHTDPGTNIMFPLCGVRCLFEAITPLADKEVWSLWY